MSDVINALQLGNQNWKRSYSLPDNLILHYKNVLSDIPKRPYDIVFLDRTVSDKEIALLQKATKAYTLFVTEQVQMDEEMSFFFSCKKGKILPMSDIQEFLWKETRNYYAKPYGEKFKMQNISIAQGFSGNVTWNGDYSVTIEGDFGNELMQALFWRNNIPVFQGQAIDLWLEYETHGDVEIALSATQFVQGTLSSIQQEWLFTKKDLEDVVILDNQMANGPVFFSVLAKGKGLIKIIALHDRYSRRGHGAFLPGGERYVASNREEVFAYFDPGDRKPPLNVYFSGYKTLQGFEGYNIMRKMGCPFLLIAEPRLEGGCFYMGSEEYEKMLVSIIHKYMEELGFTNQQVIFSGLSMGTYGALYYGCDILPHAMILGKPLASIGDVAANERLHRPGGFPTSLDVLGFVTGAVNNEAIQKLNNKFWDKFDAADWGNSKFIMSYMIEDDYDATAYKELISHMDDDGVQVYGKGIHGRHNDDTGAIVGWFISQYHRVLMEDFRRRIEK